MTVETATAQPTNAITGRPYTEGNIFRLLDTPFMDQRWATFKQWKDAGFKVMKGSNRVDQNRISYR